MIELMGGSAGLPGIGLPDRAVSARLAPDPAGAVPCHPARIRGIS